MIALVAIAAIGLILFPDYLRGIFNTICLSLIVGFGYLIKYFKTKDRRDLRLAILIGLFGTLIFYFASVLLAKWMEHSFRAVR
jgi:hypothetical protein